jgi:hypothetical protein
MHDALKTVCGARNKQGKPCQSSPMSGKRRCRLHGGATPKGRQQSPIKHGLYSRKLTDEEKALWPTIKPGSLDDEICLARIILHRLSVMHEQIQAAPNDPNNMACFVMTEVTIGRPDGTTITMKVLDTFALIDRLLGRIARLELTWARLIAVMREREEVGGECVPLPWGDWMGSGSPREPR